MPENSRPAHVIGIDLGGTKVAGAVVRRDGAIVHRQVESLDGRTGTDVGRLIAGMVRALAREAGPQRCEAVGVCVPGISWSESGRVWAPNIPGWEDYPLRDELLGLFEDRRPVVSVDSDRACSVLGELWKGAARGCSHAVFLAVGTGIGAGIVVDGKVVRGANDIAGATGWMALERPFREEYVSCGCFEYQASGAGLARVARDYLRERRDYRGELRRLDPDAITAREVFAAYDRHDPLAEDVLRNAISFWGMAAANFVSLFNPEVVIFGGGVFGPAVRLLPDIAAEARRWGQPLSMRSVRFVASSLGSDAALYGAARLALQSLPQHDTPNRPTP